MDCSDTSNFFLLYQSWIFFSTPTSNVNFTFEKEKEKTAKILHKPLVCNIKEKMVDITFVILQVLV
jgi:hypothetical protein